MKRFSLLLAVSLIVLLALSSCWFTKEETKDTELIGTVWKLVSGTEYNATTETYDTTTMPMDWLTMVIDMTELMQGDTSLYVMFFYQLYRSV